MKASYSVGDYRAGNASIWDDINIYLYSKLLCVTKSALRHLKCLQETQDHTSLFDSSKGVVILRRPRLDFIFEANERFNNQTVLLDGAFEEGEPLHTAKAARNQ